MFSENSQKIDAKCKLTEDSAKNVIYNFCFIRTVLENSLTSF